ncbi:MAG: type II secretion system F family protein [Clostridium argentinense]|uniref:Type II secretion system F family protein n=1 Tax=Clostridium faecium TaxID=2762223 RepID=A0ABR8YQH7_9CLOT|nr:MULTISPECIES: type II secretion system F family protein [Clostridium]MBD8046490.1 type II secretion system F family protein [Clostridium faecium]MBS5823210.1 type II secretion system F family protein [Clostridium argentinense]MDU1349004.1 type II secretion system F family protein [Clostridium argentinense]
MKYRFIAKDLNNNTIRGYEFGENNIELLRKLKKKKLFCIKYFEVKDLPIEKFSLVSYKDIAMFCKHMSLSIKSGMNFIDILNLLIYKTSNKSLKGSLNEIKNDVKNGNSLYDSMKNYPKIYPKLLINMVRLGQESGNLDEIFTNLHDYYLSRYKIKKKITSSLIYPLIILILGVVVQLFFMTRLLPQFISQFEVGSGELPGITMFYLKFSNFLIAHKFLLLMMFLVIGIVLIIKSSSILKNKAVSKLIIKIPLVRNFITKRFQESFSSNMYLLLESGINLVKVYEIAISCTNNSYIKEKLSNSLKVLKLGNSLSRSLSTVEIFPESYINIISIGEESGNLKQSFKTLKDILEDEINDFLEKLISITQPAAIILVGLLVGTAIIAMLMPMFTLLENVV